MSADIFENLFASINSAYELRLTSTVRNGTLGWRKKRF